MISIAILEDDEDLLESYKIWFTRRGFAVEIYNTYQAFAVEPNLNSFDVILLDYKLTGTPFNGVEIAQIIKEGKGYTNKIILVTGSVFNNLIEVNTYIDHIVEKPFSLAELGKTIEALVPQNL